MPKVSAARLREIRREGISGNPEKDATVLGVSHTIGGKTFQLVFSYGALSIASKKLRELGIRVNLLLSLNFTMLDADALPALFYAAVFLQHPEFTYAEAVTLVDVDTWEPLFVALADAYEMALTRAVQKRKGKSDPLPVEQS
ncbi:MAG TPA: hypothetical protein VGE93_08605 [Bryobacteraceae bacterium]